jgi:O-antigen/teichoic acid export membrane protein
MKDELINLEIVKSIKIIAKGSLIIFSTLIFAYIIAFISKILLAKYLGPDNYGIFNYALSIISIIGFFSTISIPTSIAHYLPIYLEKHKIFRIRGLILSSLKIILGLSLIIIILLNILLFLPLNIVRNHDMKIVLIFLSMTIPFIALSTILTSIFQGFQQTKQPAIYNNLITNILELLLIILIIVISVSLINMIIAYIISIILPSILFLSIFLKDIKKLIHWKWTGSKEYKLLLFYSIPLFISTIISNIAGQLNIIIFGFYYPFSDIGIYSTAIILMSIFSFFQSSINFLYFPIFSRLYEYKMENEYKSIYKIMNKWLLLISLPVILIFILYPKEILLNIFGQNYSSGVNVLFIITIGYIFVTISILSANSLLAMGKTKLFMYLSIINASSIIVLGIIFIPSFGMNGAAISLTMTYFLSMICCLISFYKYTKLHFISYKLIYLVITFILINFGIFILLQQLNSNSLFLIIIQFGISILVLVGLIVVVKGLEKNEVIVLEILLKKIGIKSKFIKKILNMSYS